MIDYGEVVGDGIAAGLGMLWSGGTANPWTAILFVGIILGVRWLQLTPTHRRRR